MARRSHNRRSHRADRRGSSPPPEIARVRLARLSRPFLIGSSIGLLFVGLLESSYHLCGFSPVTGALALPLSAGFLSLGVVLAVRFRAIAGSRLGNRMGGNRRELEERRQLAASIASFVAGLAALVLPEWIDVVGETGQAMWEAMLWSNGSRVILSTVLITLAAAPLILVGVSLVLVTHASAASSRHMTEWVVAPLMGSGVALIVLGAFESADGGAALLLRIAAIPLLLCAILSVARKSKPNIDPRAHLVNQTIEEPELRGFRPTLLRLAGGIAMVCVAAVGGLWTHVVSVIQVGSLGLTHAAIGVVLLAFCIGAGWTNGQARKRDQIGVCGASCALGGAIVALSALMFAIIFRQTDIPFRHTIGFAGLWMLCVVPAVAFLGRAIGKIRVALMRQAAPLESNDVSFLCALLLFGSIGATWSTWLLLDQLGSLVALAAVALAMLACGGVLIIHAPTSEGSRRSVRIVGVFAVILLMMVTLPPIREEWLRPRQNRRVQFVESWWGATVRNNVGELYPYMANRSAAPIGCDAIHHAIASYPADRVAMFGAMPTCDAESPYASIQQLTTASPLSWTDKLHDMRDRFDVLVVSFLGLPNDMVRRVVSDMACGPVARTVSFDGVLVVLMSDSDNLRRAKASMVSSITRDHDFSSQQSIVDSTGFDVMVFARGDLEPGNYFASQGDSSIRIDDRSESPSAFAATIQGSVP